MKNLSYFLVSIFLVSCTSNTIFKEPKDLIPRDTMTLLLGDMMIASSAKFVKNKNEQKKVNYMAFIYDKYKIDSLRFQNSNLYYTSKIDLYEEMITDVKKNLEEKKDFYNKMSSRKDSIRRDSIKKVGKKLKELDSIKEIEPILEPTKDDFEIKN
ncbi:hypothetical protein BTO15_06420 [Polaribacter sejongensis]|uniref:DUF4296 domain-containing protein n=1 Tax=Polaribacter sejongensis TaxID=985043 RepID=A0AAJ1QUP2_9FLAO|nr:MULTISPECIES: DUF4296 domain-containing protein [Polaribacter]AUC21763.1 hypothetical protein BTO15_06420 [Polaribacter sejongensis]MDN3618390.1 DUF4296 domain-containing protein [Polaribacter undariae]UWD30626.1 DUF4296 domain-containing protein [Polaribacter undariae]